MHWDSWYNGFVSGRTGQPVIPEISQKVLWESHLLIPSCVIADASWKSTFPIHLSSLSLTFYSLHQVIIFSFTYVSIWWPSTEVRALPCSENTSVDKTVVPGPGCLQSLWHNWIMLGCGAVSTSCIGLAWEISALLGPLSQDWILNRRQRSECLSKRKSRDAVQPWRGLRSSSLLPVTVTMGYFEPKGSQCRCDYRCCPL